MSEIKIRAKLTSSSGSVNYFPIDSIIKYFSLDDNHYEVKSNNLVKTELFDIKCNKCEDMFTVASKKQKFKYCDNCVSLDLSLLLENRKTLD